MDSKSQLAQRCQLQHQAYPVYAHMPVEQNGTLAFRAQVQALGRHVGWANTFPRKAAAEQNAALRLLQQLDLDQCIPNKITCAPSVSTGTGTACIWMIDLENVQHEIPVPRYNHLYLGFASSTHHVTARFANWFRATGINQLAELRKINHHNLIMFTCPGTIPDLVDHYMTCMAPAVAWQAHTEQCKRVCIVTSDRAGWCTKVFMDMFLQEQNITGIEVVVEPRVT